jgi:hypothetical protein
MVVIYAGLRPESDCSGKAQKQLHSKLQIHPLVREGVPHQETPKIDWPTDHHRSQLNFNFNTFEAWHVQLQGQVCLSNF